MQLPLGRHALLVAATLGWVTAPLATARGQGAPPAELLQILRQNALTPVSGRERAHVDSLALARVARVRPSFDANGRPVRAWAFQWDPEYAHPMVSVGTRVALAVGDGSGTVRLTRVAARLAVAPGQGRLDDGCEQPPVNRRGWAYLLDGPAASLGFAPTPEAAVWMLPAETQLRTDTASVPAARAALKPYYDRERAHVFRAAVAANRGIYGAADIRRAIYGESRESDPYLRAEVYAVRTTHGERFVAVLDYNDDPSDHGLTTQRTVLFASDGTVLATVDHALRIVAIADVDADGTDEVILEDGFARVTSMGLQLPPTRSREACN